MPDQIHCKSQVFFPNSSCESCSRADWKSQSINGGVCVRNNFAFVCTSCFCISFDHGIWFCHEMPVCLNRVETSPPPSNRKLHEIHKIPYCLHVGSWNFKPWAIDPAMLENLLCMFFLGKFGVVFYFCCFLHIFTPWSLGNMIQCDYIFNRIYGFNLIGFLQGGRGDSPSLP